MHLADVLRDAQSLLRAHRVQAPELTARVLLAETLACDQAWLVAHDDEPIGDADLARYHEMLRARCDGVPTQYIRGVQEFYGLEFQVNSNVLIPRPETEHLVEAALERIRTGDQVVDIGTGSGAIAISLARHGPSATFVASDISPSAVRIAKANADRLGATVEFCVGDLTSALAAGSFDIVVSNPPYVPLHDAPGLQRELLHEPSIALYGGEDGLRIIARLVKDARRVLKPHGWLLAEIGFGSRPALERMLNESHWGDPEFIRDLAGIDRVIAVRARS